MIVSPYPNSLYRRIIGDQLRDATEIEDASFVIDNYTLNSLVDDNAVKDYFKNSWNAWKNNPQSKLFVCFLEEIISEGLWEYNQKFNKIINFCKNNNIPGSKIVVISANFKSRENIEVFLSDKIPGVMVANVCFSEYYAAVHFKERNYSHLIRPTLPIKKFSFLSRHYKNWRHYFVGKLYIADILKDCYFSFHNIDPYDGPNFTTYSDDFIISKLNEIDSSFSKELAATDFYSHLPFKLPVNDDLSSLHSTTAIDQIYASSKISIVIETLFPYKEEDFHATEKIYKAIAYNKPFIIFGSHLFLKNLRSMGYRTFSPYIDETYDTIENPIDRVNAIIAEMTRINNLSDDALESLVHNCNSVVRWNSNRLRQRENFYFGTQIDPSIDWIFFEQRS